MKKLAQMEGYRLIHSPRLIVLLIGLIVLSVTGTCMQHTIGKNTMEQFYGILGDERYLGFFATLIGAYYYCMDYQNRTYSPAICRGYSRSRIYAVKLLGYLILTTVISTGSALISVLISVDGIMDLGTTFVLEKLILRVCLDFRIWAVPLVLVHLFKKLIPSILFGFACGFLFLTSSGSNVALWLSSELGWLYAAGSFLLVLIAAWIGNILFHKAEFK